MTSLARNYARQRSIDVLMDALDLRQQVAADVVDTIAAYLAVGDEQTALRARIANLRACLASIEAKVALTNERFPNGVGYGPALDQIEHAARSALENDDKAEGTKP